MGRSALRILLLGSPQVLCGDTVVHIQRRVPRALLFYLASRGEMVGRPDLLLLFWGDCPEEQARRHLRENLAKLRAELPDPDVVVAEQDRVGLDFERVYVDVREFENLIGQTNRSLNRLSAKDPLPESVYQQILKAVRLWRSPIFLADTKLPESRDLENWYAGMCDRLGYVRQTALTRLAAHAAIQGDLEMAIQWARQELETDRLNVEMHSHVLRWLIQLRRYSDAIGYCRLVQSLYTREEDDIPPVLLALCREVRRLAGIHPLNTDTLTRRLVSAEAHKAAFVGREVLMKELRGSLQGGSTLLLLGEAGIGKTRLAVEIFQTLEDGARLLIAAGQNQLSHLQFQPLVDLLRSAMSDSDWRHMDAVWVARLSGLLPELLDLRADVIPLLTHLKDEPGAVYEALHQAFLRMADPRPVFFILDDTQWCDDSTVSFITYLLQHGFFVEHGMLVLISRLEQQHPLVAQLSKTAVLSARLLVWELAPLSQSGVANLAQVVLGAPLSEEIALRLKQDTGGNPFYLIETVRAMLEAPGCDYGEHFPLARSVHVRIRERLNLLSATALEVLTQAAVIGNEFPSDLLEGCLPLSLDELASALEELERQCFIRPAVDMPPSGGYVFVQGLVCYVLLMELGQARSRALHLRVAQAIEKRKLQLPDQHAQLAQHYLAAGRLREAYHAWLHTGEQAFRLLALPEALQAYRNANQLLERIEPQLGERELYDGLNRWAEIAFDLGDLNELQNACAALRRVGELRRSTFLIGCSYSSLSGYYALQHQFSDALQCMQHAHSYLDRTHDLHETIQLNYREGCLYTSLGDYRKAAETFEIAVSHTLEVESLQTLEVLTKAEQHLSLVYLRTGAAGRARELSERYLKDGRRLGPGPAMANAFIMLAMTNYYLGDYAAAQQAFQHGLKMSVELNNRFLESMAQLVGARIALTTGRLDEAWRLANAAQGLADRNQFFSLQTEVLCLTGDIFYQLQDYTRALEYYQRSANGNGELFHALDHQTRLARSLMVSGDVEKALQVSEMAYERAHQAGLGLITLPLLNVRALIFFRMGEKETAYELGRMVEAQSDEIGLPTLGFILQYIKAMDAIQNGELYSVIYHLCQPILTRAAQLPNPWLELLVLQMLCPVWKRTQPLEYADPLERIRALLDVLKQFTQEREIRPAFDALCHKMLKKLT